MPWSMELVLLRGGWYPFSLVQQARSLTPSQFCPSIISETFYFNSHLNVDSLGKDAWSNLKAVSVCGKSGWVNQLGPGRDSSFFV